jgi:glycosyltransferase involved in cell wall biosynthesis
MIVDDVRGLATAIVSLASDPDRRREMAAEARQGAGRFDLGARIAQVEALYRDLLGRVDR